MDAHPSTARELPRCVYPFECPQCGQRLGDVVEWHGKRYFLRGGVLHRSLEGVCLHCERKISLSFGAEVF